METYADIIDPAVAAMSTVRRVRTSSSSFAAAGTTRLLQRTAPGFAMAQLFQTLWTASFRTKYKSLSCFICTPSACCSCKLWWAFFRPLDCCAAGCVHQNEIKNKELILCQLRRCDLSAGYPTSQVAQETQACPGSNRYCQARPSTWASDLALFTK
jgi:hypothetical protein